MCALSFVVHYLVMFKQLRSCVRLEMSHHSCDSTAVIDGGNEIDNDMSIECRVEIISCLLAVE